MKKTLLALVLSVGSLAFMSQSHASDLGNLLRDAANKGKMPVKSDYSTPQGRVRGINRAADFIDSAMNCASSLTTIQRMDELMGANNILLNVAANIPNINDPLRQTVLDAADQALDLQRTIYSVCPGK